MTIFTVRGLMAGVLFSTCLAAQSWTIISKSGTTFRDLSGMGEQSSPYPYYAFYMPFPTSTGVYADPACSGSGAQYQLFDWLAADTTSPNPTRYWTGPLTGNLLRNPGQLYISNYTYNVKGLEYDGALGGKITGNSDPNQSAPHDTLTEAVFVHQRYCYDGGPEFGFYRNLQTYYDFPNWIYFYYSDKTNCTGIGPGIFYNPNNPNDPRNNQQVTQSNCIDSNGQSLSNELPSQGGGQGVQIQAPTIQNSIGQYDWLYRAYVSGPTQFKIEVLDPYNGAPQGSPVYVNVDPFFQPYTQQMWNNGQGSQFWGYVTIAMNKGLDRDRNYTNRGDLTPNFFDYPAVGVTSIGVLQ